MNDTPIQLGAPGPSALLYQQFNRSYEEVSRLSESPLEPNEFYSPFLKHALAGTGSSAGAVWVRDSEGKCRCEQEIHFGKLGLKEDDNSAPERYRLWATLSPPSRRLFFPRSRHRRRASTPRFRTT